MSSYIYVSAASSNGANVIFRLFFQLDISIVERGMFTKPELDEICTQLSPNEWINPHKSMLGLGSYDINVIMRALRAKGCEGIWFDKRKYAQNLSVTFESFRPLLAVCK